MVTSSIYICPIGPTMYLSLIHISTEENHVKVNLQMETNLPGLFACGDIAGKPYQYIKAAGQGNVAALSAAEYLDKKKREI